VATRNRQRLPISRQNHRKTARESEPGRRKSWWVITKTYGPRNAGKGESGNGTEQVEEGEQMLSCCANSECAKPFLKLREGKLFLVETDRLAKPGQSAVPPFVRARQQQRVVEHYWLCDDCAAQWTLIYDREHGVALAPLRRPVVSADATSCGAQRNIA
jgi:hypothetical protein